MDDSERNLSNQVLGHIKDIRVALSRNRDTKFDAYIQGHVWKIRLMGKIIFIDITDGTGAIQIVCDKQNFSEENWNIIKRLPKGAHIDVEGITGITPRGFVSIFANHVSKRLSPKCPNGEKEGTPVSEMAEEMMGLFMLARVRRILQDCLRNLKYDEIETPLFYRFSWHLAKSYPVVKFNGVGPGIPIAPSPAPLLRRAVLDGMHEVFAFSRIYSTNLRIGDRSHENFILCVRKADPLEVEMARLAENLIKEILSNFRTCPPQGSYQQDWIQKDKLWGIKKTYTDQIQFSVMEPIIIMNSVENGNIERLHIFAKPTEIKNVFWIYWPDSLCLAEGHTEIIDGLVQVGGVVIYLDVITKVILGRESIYLHRAALNRPLSRPNRK